MASDATMQEINRTLQELVRATNAQTAAIKALAEKVPNVTNVVTYSHVEGEVKPSYIFQDIPGGYSSVGDPNPNLGGGGFGGRGQTSKGTSPPWGG